MATMAGLRSALARLEASAADISLVGFPSQLAAVLGVLAPVLVVSAPISVAFQP